MMSVLLAFVLSSNVSALTCPGFVGHVTFQDYDGPVTFEMCVSQFQIATPNVYMTLYNPEQDGIFRNGFD